MKNNNFKIIFNQSAGTQMAWKSALKPRFQPKNGFSADMAGNFLGDYPAYPNK